MEVVMLRGTKEKLSNVPVIEGQILFTTDEGKIYLDVAGTSDSPGTESDRVSLYEVALNAKQDTLVFGTAYDKNTNKVATLKDIEAATEGLSGAMHFIGTSVSDPTAEDGPTIIGYSKPFQAGDVCLYDIREYVYDAEKEQWRELGTEGSYAVKGSIKDSDISSDAAINQSKVSGLTDTIDGLKGSESDTKDSVSIAGAKKYAESLMQEVKLEWGTFPAE